MFGNPVKFFLKIYLNEFSIYLLIGIVRKLSVSGGALIDSQCSIASQRRGSTQSDTSALVSSLTRDLSQSPLTKDLSPSPSHSSSSPVKRDYTMDDLTGGKCYGGIVKKWLCQGEI